MTELISRRTLITKGAKIAAGLILGGSAAKVLAGCAPGEKERGGLVVEPAQTAAAKKQKELEEAWQKKVKKAQEKSGERMYALRQVLADCGIPQKNWGDDNFLWWDGVHIDKNGGVGVLTLVAPDGIDLVDIAPIMKKIPPDVRKIDLEGKSFTGIVKGHFPRLGTLDIRCTRVTDIDAEVMRHLGELFMRGSLLEETLGSDGTRALERRYKGCTIFSRHTDMTEEETDQTLWNKDPCDGKTTLP